jgi:hypothetical protein
VHTGNDGDVWQPLRDVAMQPLVDAARRDAVPLLLRILDCELPPAEMLRSLLSCATSLEAMLRLNPADMTFLSQCVCDSATLRNVRIVNIVSAIRDRLSMSIAKDMMRIFRECPNVVRIVGLDNDPRVEGEFGDSDDEECSILACDRVGLVEFDIHSGDESRQNRTLRVVGLNRKTAEILRCAPELGDGQYADSGGDLQLLPNELLCMVAAALPTAADVLRLGWTCRLLRDCAMCNYVACLRHNVAGIDWRWTYRAAYAVHDADYIWCKYH